MRPGSMSATNSWKIGGRPIASPDDVTAVLGRHKPNDIVPVVYI